MGQREDGGFRSNAGATQILCDSSGPCNAVHCYLCCKLQKKLGDDYARLPRTVVMYCEGRMGRLMPLSSIFSVGAVSMAEQLTR